MLKNLALAALLFPLSQQPTAPAADHQTILEVSLDEEATNQLRWKAGWHDKNHGLLSKPAVFYTLDFSAETLAIHGGPTIKLEDMSQVLRATDYQAWTVAMTLYTRGGLACEGLTITVEPRVFSWDTATATYRVQAQGKTILAMTAGKGISCGPDRLIPFPGNLEEVFNRASMSLLNTVVQLTTIAEEATAAEKPKTKVQNHWKSLKPLRLGRVIQAAALQRSADNLLAGRVQ